MIIKVNIMTCADCRHQDHSGAFTKGGAQMICGHSNAAEVLNVPPEIWKRRVLDKDNPCKIPDYIPKWCPLKYGFKY
jgi:hypothetical protein